MEGEIATLIRRKRTACAMEAQELEERAGIAEEAERARSAHHPLHWDSDALDGSEQAQRETAEYWEDQRRTTAYRLRAAYFSVSDVEIRKRLIAEERELEDLIGELFVQQAREAVAALEKAHMPRPTWWIRAAVVAAILIAAGYNLFGMAGALGGTVVGFFLGRYFEDLSKAEYADRISRAKNELKEAQASETEILNRPRIFSREEEKTGEPDRIGRSYHASPHLT